MATLAEALVGTWQLERWELVYADGRPPECPLGEDAIGFLIYSPDGHVSASLARARRAPLDRGDDGAKARAFDAYFGYAGHYAVRDGAVVHTVAMAPDPALTGVETVRQVALSGDRMVLTGPDFTAGSPRSHRIVWRRAPSARSG
jgi:Lipocalin-like domain